MLEKLFIKLQAFYCSKFGHRFIYEWVYNGRLNVKIPERECSFCGFFDVDFKIEQQKEFYADACPDCGQWICTSGICVNCGHGGHGR